MSRILGIFLVLQSHIWENRTYQFNVNSLIITLAALTIRKHWNCENFWKHYKEIKKMKFLNFWGCFLKIIVWTFLTTDYRIESLFKFPTLFSISRDGDGIQMTVYRDLNICISIGSLSPCAGSREWRFVEGRTNELCLYFSLIAEAERILYVAPHPGPIVSCQSSPSWMKFVAFLR